jgi:secondary thiamine-phosphate synthase enzyme
VIETIEVRSTAREEMIEVTEPIRGAVARAGVKDGVVYVYCTHTTAGVTVQENADPDVRSDMLAHLARAVPQDPRFRHSEGNADAHIKSSLIGVTVTLLIERGQLLVGRWQGVYFCEFDGPRTRTLRVKVVAG